MKDIPAPTEGKGMYLLIPHTPHVIARSFVLILSFNATTVSIDLARPGRSALKAVLVRNPATLPKPPSELLTGCTYAFYLIFNATHRTRCRAIIDANKRIGCCKVQH